MSGVMYLGNQMVSPVIIEGNGGGTKHGCSIDTFLGDTNASGVLQFPTDGGKDIIFTGFTDVGDDVLKYKFYNNPNLTNGVVFQDLEDVSGEEGCYLAFQYCGLTSASFPSLATISGYYGCYYMFGHCTNLTSVSFPNLTAISEVAACYGMFNDCRNLTSVSFPSLTTISGDEGCYYMFGDCTNLTSVSFPNLTTIGEEYTFASMFYYCPHLEDVSFPALTTSSFGSYTNQFNNMMAEAYTYRKHTIHFPSNLQSTIEGLSGYPTFGGPSRYVVCAFDLPATS